MMLRAFAGGVCRLAAVLLCAPAAATAQELAAVNARVLSLPSAPPSLSPDCRSKRLPGEAFRRPLPALRRAVRASRKVKVLAIGSSSTVGVGASSQAATYVAKLETSLEGTLKGFDFEVIGRGQSGEVAQGAADRMKREVEEAKPDVVVWQVGTNDALRQVSLDRFKQCLKTTLVWLKEQRIDVVLVDPQYGDALAKDEYYERVVGAIADVARERGVLLVDRFEAMRELARQNGDRFYLAADNLHLNDTGHRCTAEQLARSMVAGLLTADADAAQPVFYP
jgi:acyl-CoA thioesterase I